jgi:endonuclease/exonuclease/phosphatase family metal-dependent hydrolase
LSRRQLAVQKLPAQIGDNPCKVSPLTHLTEASWRKQGLWALLTVNPNAWDATTSLVLPFAPDDVVLLQETKIFRERFRRTASVGARRLGWNLVLNLALPTGGTMGSAGCGVLGKIGTGITKIDHRAIDNVCSHRVLVTWVAAVVKGGLYVISIYLIDTVGLNDANRAILEAVAQVIKTIKGPWIIAGDFNMNPDILLA